MDFSRWRWLLVCVLALAAMPREAAASSSEDRAFDSAARALTNTFYGRAEAGFAEFATNYPASRRLPEAVLLQAEAQLKQSKFAAAITLLSDHQNRAGKWADEYLFWLGQAYLQRGDANSNKDESQARDYQAARELFSKLPQQFPASSRNLEAEVCEAGACSKLGEWTEVSALLQRPTGVFQTAVATNLVNDWVLRGYLLLSEALRMQKDYRKAEATLQPMSKLLLKPELAWQWQYQLCIIAQEDGHPETALEGTTNLLKQAVESGQPKLQAESAALQAGLFEQLQPPRWEEAIAAYRNNLQPGMPLERQRQALWKITELYVTQDKILQAAQCLEEFLTKSPDVPPADQAYFRLGELRLLQFRTAPGTSGAAIGITNAPVETNALARAVDAFNTVINRFPISSYLGKAELNLGWCYWLQTNLTQAGAALRSAVNSLPVSPEQAIAYFKLADTQFAQTNFAGAISNYTAIIDRFEGLVEVRTNLFEAALYQTVRAALAAHELSAADEALRKLLAWYPNSFHANGALLLTGQVIGQRDPEAARELYLRFVSAATNAPLLPEVRLAIARTYEQQNDWPVALEHYDQWLATFSNHNVLKPEAEYYRARAYAQVHGETNALASFTNIVVHFPTNNEFAPLAQWWVGDYYFRQHDYPKAQDSYERLFLNTNWHRPDLFYQAQMMAGRAAFAWNGWSDAERYFTSLTSDTNCPADLWVKAMFAYGDTVMSRESTNKMADYDMAGQIYGSIWQHYTNNWLALLAQASSLLQLGQFTHQYDEAITNFLKVMNSTSPWADVSARSMASDGLGNALEKQAQQTSGAEQERLLAQALDRYLDVLDPKFLRDGETRDDFWAKRAGLDAAALLESEKKWDQAMRVYSDMKDLFPPLRPTLDKRIAQDTQRAKAQEEGKPAQPPATGSPQFEESNKDGPSTAKTP